MKIDLNNTRRQAGDAYNNLIKSIKKENWLSCVVIEKMDDEQKGYINDLRMMVGAMLYSYIPDDDDFKVIDMDLENIYGED